MNGTVVLQSSSVLTNLDYYFDFSYQNGPDTYLLQLRDVDFPVRLREYMKVAVNRSPGYSLNVHETYDPRVGDPFHCHINYDYALYIIYKQSSNIFINMKHGFFSDSNY